MPALFPPDFGPPFRNNPLLSFPPVNSLRLARVYLLEDWYACDSSRAGILFWGVDPADPSQESAKMFAGFGVTVRDPIGLIEWELAAIQDGSGDWYIPAGMTLTVWLPEDATDGHWELLKVGEMCPAFVGSDGGSGSGSGSGSKPPDRERPCELPPCPGSGVWILVCSGGGCPQWQQLESDDVLKPPTKQGLLLFPPAGLEIGEVWKDVTDSTQYPILRIRNY